MNLLIGAEKHADRLLGERPCRAPHPRRARERQLCWNANLLIGAEQTRGPIAR